MVPSHPDVLVVRNNTQVNMGTFSLGAGGANPRRPVTAQVTSMGWSFDDFLGRLTPLDAPAT